MVFGLVITARLDVEEKERRGSGRSHKICTIQYNNNNQIY